MIEALKPPDDFEETFSMENLSARLSEQALKLSRQKSRMHLDKSRFIDICDELFSSTGAQIENNLLKRDLTVQLFEGLSDESLFIEILWGLEEDPMLIKQVLIEAFPTGEIFVHGSAVGNTVLGPSQWKDNELKIEALRKAETNPFALS